MSARLDSHGDVENAASTTAKRLGDRDRRDALTDHVRPDIRTLATGLG